MIKWVDAYNPENTGTMTKEAWLNFRSENPDSVKRYKNVGEFYPEKSVNTDKDFIVDKPKNNEDDSANTPGDSVESD